MDTALKQTNRCQNKTMALRWAMCQAAHCQLVGKAGLLLETESKSLFSLKSHKPDAKNQTSIRKVEEHFRLVQNNLFWLIDFNQVTCHIELNKAVRDTISRTL